MYRSVNARIVGPAWMVSAGFFFAVINTGLQYLGTQKIANAPSAVLYQYGIALLFFLPLMFKNHGLMRALRSEFRSLHLLRVFVSVVGIQLWTAALARNVPIWQGIALLMTSPLFSTIGSGLVLREKVSPTRWLATLVGFCGAALILEPWSDAFSWKSLLPVGAAFFWSTASLLTKFTVNRDEGGPATIVFYLLALMLPFDFFIGLPELQIPSSGSAWGILLVIGALTALAQWAIAKAYSLSDASYLQPFDHVKLLFNVLAGFIAFHYVPPGRLWWGAALIVGAISWVTYFDHPQNAVKILWDKNHPRA